jgi:hypothetical protein
VVVEHQPEHLLEVEALEDIEHLPVLAAAVLLLNLNLQLLLD